MIVFEGDLNLLVAAPMLQDSFVDKDGSPMSGGTITCYHDNSRTTLKNWYYQTGSGGSYLYIALPNPLTLSAAGTITDINGVDTIPFFYPYDLANNNEADPYYITIVNYERTNQITRENFPFIPPQGAVTETVNTFNNLIINPGFWRNIQPNTVNVTPYTSVTLNSIMTQNTSLDNKYVCTVAPSQHDGFRFQDIEFIKNNLSGTDVVTFTPFPLGSSQPISNNIVPEYYVNHACNSPGTGETIKCYQFPISLHVNTLANVPFTFSIQAQNAGGTNVGQNAITIFIYQDTGSGGTPVAPIELEQFVLNPGWDLYTATGVFPSTAGLNLGLGADDALYLQVQMPLNTVCTINFTKPSIYLTQGILPTNNFQTYDQVDTVINSARTGDLRISINSFYNSVQKWLYGWLPMDDGSIGNALSNASTRANADSWPLYNMLWQLGKPYDTGIPFNPISQMFSSANAHINYGSSAISDFNANNGLQLTYMFGRVLMGTVPINALLPGSGTMPVTVSNPSAAILLFTQAFPNDQYIYQGAPITFTTTGTFPGNIVGNYVYYVTNIASGGANTFQVALHYSNAISGIAVTYSSSGTGTLTMRLNPTGSDSGEYAHAQTESEMAPHNHPGSVDSWTGFSTLNGTVGSPRTYAVGGGNTPIAIASDGGGVAANVVQPGTFYNILIKL